MDYYGNTLMQGLFGNAMLIRFVFQLAKLQVPFALLRSKGVEDELA